MHIHSTAVSSADAQAAGSAPLGSPLATPSAPTPPRRSLARFACERGQAAVEFALVAIPMCLMVLALIDFAKGLDYWLDINHLANLGARQAAVVGNSSQPSGNLACWVQGQAQSTELRDGGTSSVSSKMGVTINFLTGPTGTSGQIGDPVQVTVSAPYSMIPFAGGVSMTLRARATMRLERLPDPALNGASC